MNVRLLIMAVRICVSISSAASTVPVEGELVSLLIRMGKTVLVSWTVCHGNGKGLNPPQLAPSSAWVCMFPVHLFCPFQELVTFMDHLTLKGVIMMLACLLHFVSKWSKTDVMIWLIDSAYFFMFKVAIYVLCAESWSLFLILQNHTCTDSPHIVIKVYFGKLALFPADPTLACHYFICMCVQMLMNVNCSREGVNRIVLTLLDRLSALVSTTTFWHLMDWIVQVRVSQLY